MRKNHSNEKTENPNENAKTLDNNNRKQKEIIK